MGGSLTGTSEVGRGSVFTFEVAAPVAAVERVSPPEAAGPTQVANCLRILVAEDNEVNQRVIVRVLERLGYDDVSLVADGADALDALHAATREDRPYDVVLMDVQMPMLDGPGATRRLRAELGRDLPPAVWRLTANAMEGDRESALGSGADGYLTKPINRDKLASVLHSITPFELAV